MLLYSGIRRIHAANYCGPTYVTEFHEYDSLLIVPSLGSNRTSNANGVSVDYSYDVLNRLSTVTDNRLLSVNGGVTSYNYDEVGNLESYLYPNGVKTSYNYNTLNRLTSLNNGSVTYGYDGDGNRVSKTVSGVTTNYLVDTNNHTGYAQVVEELHPAR